MEKKINEILCNCYGIQKVLNNTYTRDFYLTLSAVLTEDEDKAVTENAYLWLYDHFDSIEAQIYAASLLADMVVSELEELEGIA